MLKASILLHAFLNATEGLSAHSRAYCQY